MKVSFTEVWLRIKKQFLEHWDVIFIFVLVVIVVFIADSLTNVFRKEPIPVPQENAYKIVGPLEDKVADLTDVRGMISKMDKDQIPHAPEKPTLSEEMISESNVNEIDQTLRDIRDRMREERDLRRMKIE